VDAPQCQEAGAMAEPPAFLALWNDFTRGREEEYDTWHSREHLPERVAAPGFRSGRRYFDAAHPVHRWFTLYEVTGLAAFETPQYRDLLTTPSPWSAAMRGGFSHFLRVPCREAAAAGYGLGAGLAVLRLAEGVVPDVAALAAAPGMVAARFGRRNGEGAARGFRAGGADSGAAEDFAGVLVLEALDRAAAARAFAAASAQFAPGVPPLELGGVYDLAFVFPGFRPGERVPHARPGWRAMGGEDTTT
jgi:hypothetical protein